MCIAYHNNIVLSTLNWLNLIVRFGRKKQHQQLHRNNSNLFSTPCRYTIEEWRTSHILYDACVFKHTQFQTIIGCIYSWLCAYVCDWPICAHGKAIEEFTSAFCWSLSSEPSSWNAHWLWARATATQMANDNITLFSIVRFNIYKTHTHTLANAYTHTEDLMECSTC